MFSCLLHALFYLQRYQVYVTPILNHRPQIEKGIEDEVVN